MIEMKGKYNEAKIFTDVVDSASIAQVQELCNQEFTAGSRIRLMPDIHAGAGCTIGTTMTITDKVVPNLVGVDIGCGMETTRIREGRLELQKLDKLIYDRKDLPQIKAIASWIDTHCADGEIAYMIPHDTLYCPDHFKNCQLPATPINDKLAFGFSVPGTHNFPMQFFEAKYVLTADPFPQTFVGNGEMSHKLNERFLAVRDEYFAQEATFDMGNGTTFTIWRRTVAPTRAEVEYYLSAFKEEDAQYPEMFSQIAESWLAARGL